MISGKQQPRLDIRDLFHPTKDNATPLYVRDENGNLVDVGTLKRR